MRLLVDLRSHVAGAPLITQVETDPAAESAGATPINGKYVLPVVPGAEFPVTPTSYVLNGAGEIDGRDVSSISFAHLLAQYPMFGHVYFNPLLTANHVAELDFNAILTETIGFPPTTLTYPSRVQTGTPTGDPNAPAGQMPTHTALLAANGAVSPQQPGLLVTQEIDIGPYTVDPDTGLEVGTDEFMLYWKLLDFSVSEDTANAILGPTAGQNQPALRVVKEVAQEPSDFYAYISPDDGGHWCQVGLLEPIAFSAKTTKVRLAFRNDSDQKVFIACFAVLF